MEQSQNPKNTLSTHCMKYGAITGAALIVLQLLFFFSTGMFNSSQTYIGLASIILIVASLFYFSKQYRNEFSPDFFSYGSAFKTSFLTGFYASIVVAFFVYVFYKFKPELLIQSLIEIENSFRETGYSDNEIEMMINLMQSMWSPGLLAFSHLFGETIRVVLFSLIIAIFIKKTNTLSGGEVSQFERDMSKI